MCKECEWEEFSAELDDLLSDSDYEWANETIDGILNTVTDRGHVTEGQRNAIENIKTAVERRK